LKIALVSDDLSILRVCQDVTRKLAVESPEIVMARPEHTSDADIYLWDMDLAPKIPFEEDRRGALDVFLVRRSELQSFLQRYPAARSRMLLKPVSPAALEICLTHVTIPESRSPEASTARMQADRDVLLDCLLQSTFRLQEFEQDRTNFWARAAHDLQAPLTAAAGYCGLLLDRQAGPLTHIQYDLLQRVQQSLHKLQRMATAMLQVTASHDVNGRCELKRISVEELLNRAADDMRLLASEKNITLNVLVAPPPLPLYAEPNQIEQVVLNLIENACRFTPRNGQIEVRSYPVQWSKRFRVLQVPGMLAPAKTVAACRVDVWDSGPGIPRNQLQSVFDDGFAGKEPAERSGGGLSLAICRMIIEAHQGEIWAESNGEGSTLSFVLPLTESMTDDTFAPLPLLRCEEDIVTEDR
jgi:signal transduction histidine kinase